MVMMKNLLLALATVVALCTLAPPVGAKAVRSLPASDNFNRASEVPMGGNWSVPTGGNIDAFNLSSNTFTNPIALSFNCIMYWNADSFSADQYSQATATVYNAPASYSLGIMVRVQTSGAAGGNGYYFGGVAPLGFGIYKIVGGSFTQLLATTTFTDGDVLKLTAVGTTLEAFKNGSSVGSTTDSTYSTGQAGIGGYGGAAFTVFDDWSGDNIGGGGGTTFIKAIIGPLKGGGRRLLDLER
jgi:hypothetical protein